MPNSVDIREALYESLLPQARTAFDSVVAGSTATDKVRRGGAPMMAREGGAVVRIPAPFLVIQVRQRTPGTFASFDDDAVDGRVDAIATSLTASQAGAIAKAVQARFNTTNVTATGFSLKRLRLDEDYERTTVRGETFLYQVVQFYEYEAFAT